MVKVTQNFLQCSCWHHKVCKVCVRQPQTSLHAYQPLASYPGPFDFLNGPGYEANQPHERICASTHTWQAWWQLEWTWYYLTIRLELPCSENSLWSTYICIKNELTINIGSYSRLQKSCNKLAEQWKTTIDLPHMNMIIFPPQHALPTSLFKHNKSIVVFHCSACLLEDFCNRCNGRVFKVQSTRL